MERRITLPTADVQALLSAGLDPDELAALEQRFSECFATVVAEQVRRGRASMDGFDAARVRDMTLEELLSWERTLRAGREYWRDLLGSIGAYVAVAEAAGAIAPTADA